MAAAWVSSREISVYRHKGIHALGLRGDWPETVIFAEWAGPTGEGESSTGIYKDRPPDRGQPWDLDAEAFAIDFLDAVREN